MKCNYCNNELPVGAVNCPSCGVAVQQQEAPQQPAAQQQAPAAAPAAQKSRNLYQILAFFLGQLGIHNFYAGRITIAVIQLLITVISNIIAICVFDKSGGIGPVFIWALIEIFVVKKDGRGIPMK